MPEDSTQVDNHNRAEIDRVKAIIRQTLESAKPGRNGGLLNSSNTPNTSAQHALDNIISELERELNQVTGEEANV